MTLCTAKEAEVQIQSLNLCVCLFVCIFCRLMGSKTSCHSPIQPANQWSTFIGNTDWLSWRQPLLRYKYPYVYSQLYNICNIQPLRISFLLKPHIGLNLKLITVKYLFLINIHLYIHVYKWRLWLRGRVVETQ